MLSDIIEYFLGRIKASAGSGAVDKICLTLVDMHILLT